MATKASFQIENKAGEILDGMFDAVVNRLQLAALSPSDTKARAKIIERDNALKLQFAQQMAELVEALGK